VRRRVNRDARRFRLHSLAAGRRGCERRVSSGSGFKWSKLASCNFRSADIRDGSFVGSQLKYADLTSANLRHANLQKADLQNANLEDADLFGADLGQADLTGAHLGKADLRNTDFQGTKWQEIAEIKLANVFGVKNAPSGFLEWAARIELLTCPQFRVSLCLPL
jgi:uncharacterized protein YjbI with pentapeptide repeats